MVDWNADNGGGRSCKLRSLCICASNSGDAAGCSQHHCEVMPTFHKFNLWRLNLAHDSLHTSRMLTFASDIACDFD